MGKMKDLFGDIPYEPPPPRPRGDKFTRHTDPSTSHKAADKAKRGLTEAKRKVILLHGTAFPLGLVDGELLAKWKEHFGPVKESVPRKRRFDLMEDGLIFDSGRIRTFDRCNCIVWTLTQSGLEAFKKLHERK